jgi:hypothetical protein
MKLCLKYEGVYALNPTEIKWKPGGLTDLNGMLDRLIVAWAIEEDEAEELEEDGQK